MFIGKFRDQPNLRWCRGVPVTFLARSALVQKDADMTPRQMCHSLWHIWLRLPGSQHGRHVAERPFI
jgi:hypothetical protein